MRFVLELHDGVIDDDGGQGSLVISEGGQTPYMLSEIEERLRNGEMVSASWHHAYLVLPDAWKIEAVWVRGASIGDVPVCTAWSEERARSRRDEGYSPQIRRIATCIWGKDVQTDSSALSWAHSALSNPDVSMAVVFDPRYSMIRFGWELQGTTTRLVACGPRTDH